MFWRVLVLFNFFRFFLSHFSPHKIHIILFYCRAHLAPEVEQLARPEQYLQV